MYVKGGVKTISIKEYDSIMDLATHNSSATKIMLGKYDGGSATSYITKAGSEFTYFNLGKNWDDIKSTYRYTDQDMFTLFNESFLDDGINAGKNFYFSHKPKTDTGFLGQELRYLLDNGYELINMGTQIVAVPK